jgi:hypothetical protein
MANFYRFILLYRCSISAYGKKTGFSARSMADRGFEKAHIVERESRVGWQSLRYSANQIGGSIIYASDSCTVYMCVCVSRTQGQQGAPQEGKTVPLYVWSM